jgi:GT2 family glycosyltransferase
MHVSVLLTTWNDSRYLEALFASIRAQTFPDVTIRIADNGSNDGETVPYVLHAEPHWLAVRHTKHAHRGVMINQLIRIAMERYRGNEDDHAILLAESNTVWDPEMLTVLVKKLEEDKTIAAVQPKILRAFSEHDNDDVVYSDILDTTGGEMIGRWTVDDRGAGVMDRGQFDDMSSPVLFTRGIVLFRVTALQTVIDEYGVFDDLLNESVSDDDLAFRLARAEKRVIYVPEARAHRYRGAANVSTEQGSVSSMISRCDVTVCGMKHASFWYLMMRLPKIVLWGIPRSIIDVMMKKTMRERWLRVLQNAPRVWRSRDATAKIARRSMEMMRAAFRSRT